MKKTLILLAGVAVIACADAEPDDLNAFPAAADGKERHVIRVPALGNEEMLRIELLVGKEIEVDCNQHRFGAALTKETVDGWGYSYYSIDEIAGPMSTMMACPPDEPKTLEFVTANLDDALLRYNSNLPLVVYLPAGYEARYRIWAASEEMLKATVE